MPKINKIALLLIIFSLALSGCGQKKAAVTDEQKQAIEIKVKSAVSSRQLEEKVEFPALVLADQEANIIAKAAGTAVSVNFKIGDKVKVGAQLVKIDDVDTKGAKSFNAGQIKQAQLAVQQAFASYQMARTNYDSLLLSSTKDLNQLQIAKDQAMTGKSNVNSTASESYKSAQIAYEQAQLAADQAKINLENRKKLGGQSSGDAETNAYTTADSVVVACGNIITSLNNAFAYDDNSGVVVPYANNLGVRNINSYNTAKNAYSETSRYYNDFLSANFSSALDKINAATQIVEKTRQLSDASKTLLDNSITSSNLPQTSMTGTSMSGLQSAVSGYQSAANGALSQINGVKQALANVGLNNDTTLEILEKTYELANKQVASAKQNLENLSAGNKAQKDQAGFGAQSALNQYENTKIKLDSQIAVSRSQTQLAEIQYRNALVALESLYDNHMAISPIDGVITKKMVNGGDTISAGQILATVSWPEKTKLQFYVDQDTLKYLRAGQKAEIIDGDGNRYPAKITSVTPQADAVTKRFLVEIMPEKSSGKFTLGTVMNAVVPIVKSVAGKNNTILPLSAIETGQNGNFIFIVSDNRAKKIKVEIIKVDGESAEIKADLKNDDLIIIEGNKLVKDADNVSILK